MSIKAVLEAVGLGGITPPEVAVVAHMLSGESKNEPLREKEPRELEIDETAIGKIVAQELDKSGDARYVMETDHGERVAIPWEEGMEFSMGEEIEVTRTQAGYEIADDLDYGR